MVKNRFPPWLMVLLLAAICAAVIGTVAYFRFRADSTTADLLDRLPAADSMVLYIDVSALRRAGILELLAGNQIAEEPEYKLFVEQTGFDYRGNLDSVLVAFEPGGILALIRGRFVWRSLNAYVTGQGGTCRNAFCRMTGSKPDRKISFFPLQTGILALGVSGDEWAATNLQRRTRARPAFQIPSRPVWLRIPPSALKGNESLPAGTRLFARAIESARETMISLGAESGRLEAYLDVTCQSADDASVLVTQLQAVTTLLRGLIAKEGKAPNPKDLSGVLVAGTFAREDQRVHGRWPVPNAFLEALVGGSL